ncbi:hypothetical protein K402DRAFT_396952 [Aulographum hederae CBS 113979]|uniref:Small ribosomal subunit protein mS23 n=1 Tax=Aulographum hederae CBS 113979 TaxID=1176131 RepID=A0A6G1GQD0_9PEZI|nr:hypothetical protein K402DRAFT_396952 [Aulographum hederae CBS 113979]
MFKPIAIHFPEDALRNEFYNDHPWELARPRIVLENDGRDAEKWDWSRIDQPGKALDGENVVRRQQYIMEHGHPSRPSEKKVPASIAYDLARREFYDKRLESEIESRIAVEEARSQGAYFGLTELEIGDMQERKAFETWRVSAKAQVDKARDMAAGEGEGQDAVAQVFGVQRDAGDEELEAEEEEAPYDVMAEEAKARKDNT